MNKILFVFCILAILCVPNVLAQHNSIKLMAVNEATKKGTIVDLGLDVIDGSGKIFIETYPLSQIDTQISLRIAKINACKITGSYCLDKDFLYSISSNSPIIAGPSAGAAVTLLTMASLEGKTLNPDLIITGTINSGGVIGVVGGIKEKVGAAANASIKTVLIPKGEDNSTQIIEYGKSLGVDVIEISNIEEAYSMFTGKVISEPQISIDENYKKIMKSLDEDICKRADNLKSEIEKLNLSNDSKKTFELGLNLSKEAQNLSEKGIYYSSASRCFGSNVYFREVLLKEINLTPEQISQKSSEVKTQIKQLEEYLNSTKIDNLGDLEAVMIIRERVFDAKNNLAEVNSSSYVRPLSYAIERTYSAFAWEKFIGFPGKQIDESKLKDSCAIKINEVEELYNYVSLYFPLVLKDTKDEVESAAQHMKSGDYILCLFEGSKSEAEIDTALSAVYIQDSNVKSLLQNKIFAAKKEISKEIQKGSFPILGYSYYEYANTLNETNIYNALLYAEYGIELSDLDIYLPMNKPLPFKLNQRAAIALVVGFALAVTIFSIRRHYKRKKINFRRRR